MTAVIAVTSGKSKVGKTILSANLAWYLNQKGHRTGLLVAGAGMPLWGIAPDRTWPDILGGRLPLERAIHRDVFGTDLLVTQGQGHALQDLSTQTASRLDDPMGIMDGYAYLIVDIAAGVTPAAIACCLAATETILVPTPDTPSLTSSFDWLVQLARHGFTGPVNIILNQIRKPSLAQSIFLRFRDLTHKRLKIQANLWGAMILEDGLDSAAVRQQPLAQVMPHSKLLRDIRIIGDRLVAEQPPENQTRPLNAFWKQFIDCLRQLPAMAAAQDDRPREPATGEPAGPPPATAKQAPPNGDTQAGPEAESALAQLGAQLTAIAQELNAIRNLLETRSQASPTAPAVPPEASSESVDLDFDAFVSQKKMPQ